MPKSNEDPNKEKESIEDTLTKIAALLSDTAKKDDIDGLKSQILKFTTETNDEISKLKSSVNTVEAKANEQQDQISTLQTNVEILKQDQLKNNISIAGIPMDLVDNSNSDDVIINQLHMGKKLIVKEVFANAAANSNQIFINDHLTPYFNKLYLMARHAKKEGKLYTASSYNGRIKVRKHSDDLPILITNESQLHLLINLDSSVSVDISSNNSQLVEETQNASPEFRVFDGQIHSFYNVV